MEECISVIVPIYNVSEFLEYCVNSICNQTYRNLEIILVDDGSTDSSGEICDALAQKDARIKVIHQQNQGAAGARNSGLQAATGDYISIIDGDDYILPGMYTALHGAIQECDAQFACCTYQLVEEHNVNIADADEPHKVSKVCKQDIYNHLFDYHTMWVIQPNKLYRKELFKEYRFPTGHFYEDEYAAHRLLKKVEFAAFIDYPFYRYYVRPGSATRRGVTSRQLFLLDALMDRVIFFREENEKDMLPIAESCMFQAYRSVAVEMVDRTKKSLKDLRTFRSKYWKLIKGFSCDFNLSSKEIIRRKLYLIMPRIMEKIIMMKNNK